MAELKEKLFSEFAPVSTEEWMGEKKAGPPRGAVEK